MITVEGSSPELDIVSDNTNIVISVNYEYDVAYVMGDWGYHKTSPNHYDEKGQMRVVIGAYCSQIDETNAKMLKSISTMERIRLPLWINSRILIFIGVQAVTVFQSKSQEIGCNVKVVSSYA